MNQNVENAIQQVLDQIDDSPVMSVLAGVLKSQIDRQKVELEELLAAREQGLLTGDEFEVELEREKLIAEAEVLTAQIATKAEVQKAVNKAFNVLLKSVAV
ncbi:hypothetical protein G5S52_00700 [Grimontia sp. S25]|uniref:Uncharacterized protein n=1 Tax=Grimontia sedimenti TaxID=2711294 RepID=A0A6M1R9G5_9GAMM|nr:hypothetical protein [Grimontia sedimenti]NGN96222.1 hypothetical protein [Grimontia sedimenti]